MLAKELGMTPSLSGVESSIASNDLNAAEAAVNGRSSQNSGESFATSVAESASINIDARFGHLRSNHGELSKISKTKINDHEDPFDVILTVSAAFSADLAHMRIHVWRSAGLLLWQLLWQK